MALARLCRTSAPRHLTPTGQTPLRSCNCSSWEAPDKCRNQGAFCLPDRKPLPWWGRETEWPLRVSQGWSALPSPRPPTWPLLSPGRQSPAFPRSWKTLEGPYAPAGKLPHPSLLALHQVPPASACSGLPSPAHHSPLLVPEESR